MFKITEGDFKNQTYGDESYLSNWPMLYILENGKQAYIGESNHVKNRMSQHHSSVDKRIFDKVHFIYSSKFNQSVTFDYESKLIQYIVADELYEVRNKNAGMADKEYYGKKEYDEMFKPTSKNVVNYYNYVNPVACSGDKTDGFYKYVKKAIENVVTFSNQEESISWKEFLELDIIGDKKKRLKVYDLFHLGYGNAKTLFKRLNMVGISREMIEKELENEGYSD